MDRKLERRKAKCQKQREKAINNAGDYEIRNDKHTAQTSAARHDLC